MSAGPVTSLAATGLGVASSIMGGEAQASGDEFQAAQMERAAQYGKIKGAQTDTIMRQNLMTTLSNIRAARASANTDPNSPTGNAIEARQEQIGDQTREQRVANIAAQTQSDQAASAFYTNSAGNALLGGFLSGAGGVATGIGGGIKSGAFSSFFPTGS